MWTCWRTVSNFNAVYLLDLARPRDLLLCSERRGSLVSDSVNTNSIECCLAARQRASLRQSLRRRVSMVPLVVGWFIRELSSPKHGNT